MAALLLATGAGPALAAPVATTCEDAIRQAAASHPVPASLLLAIGRVEAGWRGRVWPWSLNLAGEPRRFASFDAAVAFLERHLAAGQRNVDAGCLQLNLAWAGRGLAARHVLDPFRNADRAAAHLADLRRRHGSWTEAVARYHTARPARGRAYVCRVAKELARILGRAPRAEAAWASSGCR